MRRTAIVTGASRGIGKEIAYQLATEGYDVVVCSRKENDLHDVVREFESAGLNAFPFAADTSNDEDVNHLVDAVMEKFARIDVLVNNAGVSYQNNLLNSSIEDWKKVIDVNLSGPYYCIKAVLPHMINNGGGKIVNISSIAGKRACPFYSAYAASKAGLISLTKSVAAEVGKHGVYVNCILPGAVKTKMFNDNLDELANAWGMTKDILEEKIKMSSSLGRTAEPEEIAKAVSFLVSPLSSAVTGSIILASCGDL